MPFASHGVRSAARKAANALRSHHGTSGGTHHGGGGAGSRALHTAPVRPPTVHNSHLTQFFATTLEQIRPRTPPHQLFSSTRGLVARLFTRLAAPGIKVPLGPNPLSNASRTLVKARPITIQSGLSLPVRHAIRNNNFGSGTFLPRAPQVPIRGPVASQVGLGTARSFSTGRPIFQNLVDNVPIAVRALYEADLDDLKTGRPKPMRRHLVVASTKKVRRTGGSKLKARPTKIEMKKPAVAKEQSFESADLERYFSAPVAPAVTTYLLIPLAPTPTNRVPLSALDDYLDRAPDIASGNGRFLPLPQVGQTHASHSNHALRVSTLFARLDQANVWSRSGVVCSAYSGPGAGIIRPRRRDQAKTNVSREDLHELEGVCTVLKVEFQGWTEAEVRGVIGESGKGWCSLEEVWHAEEENEKGYLSAAEEEGESLFSGSSLTSPASFASPLPMDTTFDMGTPNIDPAQSFVLPTLDFSSSFLSEANERRAFREAEQNVQPGVDLEYDDPWNEFDSSSSEDGYVSSGSLSPLSSISRSSSFEDVMQTSIPASPSSHGPSSTWSAVEFSSSFYEAASNVEPREVLF
ncbi:hypothetical protein CC1G_10829 [Coprinopsis cinerea okayama7|uniref:Uncharacterized protein n=1 Tax=Coprinopsis cinerea (strain Okayama-7 / 130 / ATCC MYA-4618 / FGSC 9003) TaxID=240176 RepID=A8NHH9_COPC7|nr:hypothetical protein CC1G_10829 [Coprinopsis cinerea okayama7\|eukprot:XP_001833764.1 hypothetical protein CC1G_10829 [Coprinopsis cinerea okayama7\